jgi:hypothetical protein
LGLSKIALNYYLTILKKEGLIKKVGYGVYEFNEKRNDKEYKFLTPKKKGVSGSSSQFMPKEEIRGHNFIINLKLPNILNWDKREDYLIKNNIKYKSLGNGLQIFHNGYKIHLYDQSIIIYFSKHKSIYGVDAAACYEQLIKWLYDYIHSLEILLKTRLKFANGYNFKIDRQHYAKLHDILARDFRHNKQKLEVRDNKGELWLIADYSLNVDELETVHPKTANLDMDKVILPFFNDLKLNPVLLSEILGVIKAQGDNLDLTIKGLKAITDLIHAVLLTTQEPKPKDTKESKQKDIIDYMR